MSTLYDDEFEAALVAVREAAHLCRHVRSAFDGAALIKEDRSPVTIADFGSQALICRIIRDRFPNDPIVAEEDASELRSPGNAHILAEVVESIRTRLPRASSEEVLDWIDEGNAFRFSRRFWVIDPIDGTKGFIRGDQYAIALALIVDGRVVVAALGCPNMTIDEEASGAVFCAVRDSGSFISPMEEAERPRLIQTSETFEAAKAVICESVVASHSSHSESAEVGRLLSTRHPPIRMDSQAKYAMVASGRADVYLRLPVGKHYVERIWDHAAGALIIEEAGGRVTDVDGRSLDFTHGTRLEKNRGIVATNGRLHDEVLDAVRRVLQGETVS